MKNQNIPHINELTDSELTDIILINERNDGFEIDDELINETEQLTREEKIDLVKEVLEANDYTDGWSNEGGKYDILEFFGLNPFSEYYEPIKKKEPIKNPFSDKIKSIEKVIEKSYRKLRELKEQEHEWQTEYNKEWQNLDWASYDENESPRTSGILTFRDELMEQLYNKPFNTVIDFSTMTESQRVALMPKLKEWFNQKIKHTPLTDRILCQFTINRRPFSVPIDSERNMKRLENMFNGSLLYSEENITSGEISGASANISLSIIDSITFKLLEEYKPKKGEVDRKESGFWKWRLSEKWHELEPLTSRYQIFTSLVDKQGKGRYELGYNCLCYACLMAGVSNEKVAEMSHLIGCSYVNVSHLHELGKAVNVRFTARYVKRFDGKVEQAEHREKDPKGSQGKAHGKRIKYFGALENYTHTVDLITYKNHWFLYEKVPITSYYINNYEAINENGVINHSKNVLQFIK